MRRAEKWRRSTWVGGVRAWRSVPKTGLCGNSDRILEPYVRKSQKPGRNSRTGWWLGIVSTIRYG